MSWFDTAGIASFAKSALTTAQKTIDKALDIQEEKDVRSGKNAKTVTSGDSFFEAYGLGDKPSSSQADSEPSDIQNVPGQEPKKTSAAAHGSGFWPDTWGSFFDMKSQNVSKHDYKSELSVAECNITEDNRKEGTVLSQPHRASPFPGDACIVQKSHDVQSTDEGCKSVPPGASSAETIPDKVAAEYIAAEDTKANSNEEAQLPIVTEQPSTAQVESPDVLYIETQPSLENIETHDKSEENQNVCDNEIIIDKNSEISVTSDLNSVPTPILSNQDSCMEESEFLTLNVPVTSQKIIGKGDSEYDVIDISESDISNNATENSNDSFTRSTSVEVVASASECSLYDISSSTIEVPNLPESMTENIVTWEWGGMDNTSPNLYVTDENENSGFVNHDNELNISKTLQICSPDSSFHTIAPTSFSDNHIWAQKEKSSHFIDESQNSSNEEQNSHHSDGSSNSSKDDDDTDTAEVKEYDVKSSSSAGSHATSSSSFVKCSAEENDNNSHRGQSPVSTTASERSDATKQESEQNTSGDENETATSSDIEILSPPNGENGDRNTSPLKHMWLPRPLRLRRSESPTSDSSKDSLMPVVTELEEVTYEDENSSASIYHDKNLGESCHKDYDEDANLRNLLKKQEELQNILEAREKKILDLSKDNIELQENEQRLKNLVQKMRVEQAKESRDIAALTKEFTQRLSQVENQLREALKERDTLFAQLEETKVEVAKRISAADVEEVIKEKDIQIKELTEEGQKLSKKELQHTTIIKKLRAKEEEIERTIKSQNERLEENSKEVERLRKSIGAKEEQEKKHIDAIRLLTQSVKKLEKENASLKSNLEDSSEKELSLKKSLDSTYKDLTELRKSFAAKEKELEDLKSGLEIEAKENLRQMLENANKEATKEKEMLLLQMQELRCTMSRSEEEANLREKMFKADIANLQKRLQEAEERNEDLTKNMSTATRPLVRQIENLQATCNAQIISWEKIEKNLTDRLSDSQNQLAFITEKERSAAERYMECQSKITALESQNNILRQEKLQLSAEVESLKAKIMIFEENQNRETYTIEKLKENFTSEIARLKQEKENLENTMATCLEQLDLEKKKVLKLEEEMKFKEARALIMSNSSPCPSPTGSVKSSISSIHNWSQDEGHDHGMSTPVNSYRMSVYESLRLGSGSSLLENLQSQLKQREGEIIQLQSEIAKLEQVKESMTRELVLLTEQNEILDKKINKLESVEKEYKDLDQKYNTLLQMYGEKVEETEELQLDLADVKSMYKAQIEELLRNK